MGKSKTVEYINCFFNSDYTCLFCVIYTLYDKNQVVIKHTIIPAAGIIKIKRKFENSKILLAEHIEFPPITRAAHVDSAKEPNKSAPIPAISPTLSPTLSAIVAGFLGLSSGSPA